MTIGQLPVEVCAEVTASHKPQLSVMLRPASLNAVTVVYAAGASSTSQPLTFTVARVPLITGASVSTTLMVCVKVVLKPHWSVTV